MKKPTSSGNHSDGAGAPIKRRIKKEVPDDPLVMLTPLLSDSDMSTPGSGFANSQNVKVKRDNNIIVSIDCTTDKLFWLYEACP